MILSDLDDAIAGLPEEYPAGRANANAARALKSEVCLTAAAYTTDATRKKTLWEQAVSAVDAIQGLFFWTPIMVACFNQENSYSSTEIILARYFSKENTNGGDTYMQTVILIREMISKKLGRGPLF